eukprot:4300128-Amphidinium_carterae.1
MEWEPHQSAQPNRGRLWSTRSPAKKPRRQAGSAKAPASEESEGVWRNYQGPENRCQEVGQAGSTLIRSDGPVLSASERSDSSCHAR